jgi:pimeloyl-ACP methyl ester carboxylesterase
MNIAVAIVATAMFALAAESARASDDLTRDCRIGTYHLQDGADVDIGATEGPHLRWRRPDGTTGVLTKESDGSWTSTLGWTQRPDGKRVSFSDCASGEINFDGVKGKRIAFDVTETKFQGAGVTLAGRLVMPKGSSRVPIVVLIHGSEHDSARDFYALQRLFPAEGIGAFVYDKRGTGASTGRYTQDYLLLADDAIAAVHEAKRLAGSRAGRIGYQAGSQGGWVAPLAAKIEPVDFVIVGFGLAVSPLDEDREAIALDITRHGYGADVMAKAMEVADATAAILLSDFREGYDQLEAVRRKYENEPWFKYVHGDITFALLEMSQAQLRERGPELLPHVPMQYDPMPVLRNLDVPQLWILAADDTDAPSAETARRLRALAAEGKPIVTAVFPHTDHGIYEYETKADGTRVSTRNPDGYFAMMRDFIRTGRIAKSYGTSMIFHSSHD